MPGTHLIRRQFLEVDFQAAESRGYALQTQILDLCEQSLIPALEKVFERIVPAGEHWRIDRLEVDAGELPHDGLDDTFVTAVVEAVDRQLRAQSSLGQLTRIQNAATLARMNADPSTAMATTRRSGGQVLHDAFLYFLETGLLPWWIELPAEQTLEGVIRAGWARRDDASSSPVALVAAIQNRLDSPRALRRLVRQFTVEFLMAVLAEASQTSAETVLSVLAALTRAGITVQTDSNFIFQLWETALVLSFAKQSFTAESLMSEALRGMSSHGSPPAANLFRKLAQQWPAPGQIAYADRSVEKPVAMFATKSSKVETDSSRRTELATEAALEEGVFLRCAGIVLLHPFLPRFFEGLGIARNNKLIQPERALGLLHFLATGHRTAPEYDLLLPKLLCGCMNTVVPLQIDLTPEEEEESDALLNAMIRHWDALGATSVEGLRGSYLVRPGKLSSRGEDYVLQVESRAYDILLDQLPWGIGLIKLPWMESTLWVEWRM